MAHVFEGEPDARHAGDIAPSRFRPQYRALSDEEKALHDQIETKATELETLFEQARDLRYPMSAVISGLDGISAVEMEAATIMPAEVGFAQLEPGALAAGFSATMGTDYFGEGMKSLELAVMWTVKGLTA
ncbi:hypothetical protein FBZ83_1265 [Azospirillum brasilense]|uniref:Uncharacterized protein n=1 Tax=Azospirillum brasilense TaxID=192 RepID=A0A560BMU3_AZOBR|nr:hypothetical protein [Azospirillum brasilense]TWA73938.1 hypothetical protein FBZ83_1265 [Azospirillum brasilense]